MPIDWNSVLPTRGPTVVAWVSGVFVVLAGAAWGLFSFGVTEGADKAKNQLEFYKSATAAKLPELSANLVDVTNDLKNSLKIYERNKDLEAKFSSCQQHLDEASKTRADRDATILRMQKDLEQSEAELAKLKGLSRTFTLQESQAEKLIGEFNIGFKDTNFYTREAKLIFDNKELDAGPGYTVKIDADNKHCILTVKDIHWNSLPISVDFDFTCK